MLICAVYSCILIPIANVYNDMPYNLKGWFQIKLFNRNRSDNVANNVNSLMISTLTVRAHYPVMNRKKSNYKIHATNVTLQSPRDRKLEAIIDRKKRGNTHEANVITMSAKSFEFSRMRIEADTSTFMKATLFSHAGPVTIYVYREFQDRYISGSIINGGKWEDDVGRQLQTIIEENPRVTFLDLGANVGVFTLQVALMGIPVIAVDCLYDNIERLVSAVEFNNMTKSVTIVYNAISNTRENVMLGREDMNIGGTYVKYGDTKPEFVSDKHNNVSAILLNDLVQKVLTKSVIIKMDVETSEDKVLAGGHRFFDTFDIPYVIMEWFHHKNKISGQFIKNFMRIHKYKPYALWNSRKAPLSDSTRMSWPDVVLWSKL